MIKPNILFIMCDQLRADAIAAFGNKTVRTPNIDRLAARGALFSNAYSSCPVCVPARYTVRTGREPFSTGSYSNGAFYIPEGAPTGMEERCGKYLARRMGELGYRTFGVGKFHAQPWDEDLGYETQLHSEELWSPEQRKRDAYAGFIAREHPEFAFVEQLHGERTDMYYMPQASPLPAELTVESWAADRACELISECGGKPFFGLVSFIGPHPPFAPPIPYNRMYSPDLMENPVSSDIAVDHMDAFLPWMNYAVWAEDINDSRARSLKARYYGEISYIDCCIGRILDAVEARCDNDNTLICFFCDHGDHLGDHHAWQKESFFEASCRVPFLLSWPERIPEGSACDELVCLTDLFGIATGAAGSTETRDGIDVLGMLSGSCAPRERLFGYYGRPGTREFKIMVRQGCWKYIFMSNGGREQLFNTKTDPFELRELHMTEKEIAAELARAAVCEVKSRPGLRPALSSEKLRTFEFDPGRHMRIRQFDSSRGISDFTVNGLEK